MECKQDEILQNCTCTYTSCSRMGLCCDCIAYHKRSNELPGCLFPKDAERTYNRTVKYFCEVMAKNKYKLP